MSEPHSHILDGPDGAGAYSNTLLGCYDVINNAVPKVLKALERAPELTNGEAFSICDYGTADGGTSMFLMAACINWLKERYGEDVQVHVTYEDQPVSDFKSLFKRIHGLLPGPLSYYQEYSRVFVTAAGTSFFSQCVPDNTVHHGFSANAFQYLSKRPGPLTGAIHPACSTNRAEKQVFADVAAKDWETILLHRAKELKPGGQFFVIGPCIDNDGNYLGNTPNAKYSLYQQMMECWTELYQEGKITEEECNNLQLNSYYRNEEEYGAPFSEGTPVHRAGLRLLSYRTEITRCPYQVKWFKDGNEDDPQAVRRHVELWQPNVRVWSNFAFLSALNESRTKQQKDALIDECFQKYDGRVAAAPSDHAMDHVHAYMHIAKVKQ